MQKDNPQTGFCWIPVLECGTEDSLLSICFHPVISYIRWEEERGQGQDRGPGSGEDFKLLCIK